MQVPIHFMLEDLINSGNVLLLLNSYITFVDITVIILAAGQGRRMKSSIPKVLHKVANASFLELILITIKKLNIKDVRVVASKALQAHASFKQLAKKYGFTTLIQKEARGTADAVGCAVKTNDAKPILILNGDCPLIRVKTIQRIYNTYINNELDLLCTAFNTKNPTGYGRLVTFGNDLIEIVEEKDLQDEQSKITLCNGGTYLISAHHAINLVGKITNNNVAKEFYLTDIVKHAHSEGLKISFINTKALEILGINNPLQKAKVEHLIQQRLKNKAFKNGVTFISPETVYLSYDTEFGVDVILHPFIVIGPNVAIMSNTEVFSFSDIADSTIGKNCKIGPHARLRGNNVIGDDVKIGNFVEVKASKIANNTKASHLTYIGDALIGKEVNIGAGTIFCNFDGYNKHQSTIGDNVFVGSNVALIAPVTVGRNAKIGAGSVITEDVEENQLAIVRVRQSNFKQKSGLND